MRPYALLVLLSLTLVTSCATSEPEKLQAPADPAAAKSEIHGDLLQVMRGVLYPNSNVIFAVQSADPTKMKTDGDASISPNPLTSSYGGWTAVENAGIALAESANLLTIPGRKCANGRDVPINNEDWTKFVQGLRDAGLAAYKAGQSKNQDNILAAAETMTTACSNCHDQYREKPNDADRCM